MINGKVTLKKKVDSTLDLIKNIKGLSGMEVLVGVPEENAGREGESTINNAQLVMYHTKGVPRTTPLKKYNVAHSLQIVSSGSPLWKLPPRPIIEPALEADGNKEKIEEDLKQVAELMLAGKPSEAVRALHVAGQDGVNIIKSWFTDPRNNWAKDSPLTVMAKLRKKYQSKKKRKEIMSDYNAGVEGINEILVDTGQMRDAMNYVVDVKE